MRLDWYCRSLNKIYMVAGMVLAQQVFLQHCALSWILPATRLQRGGGLLSPSSPLLYHYLSRRQLPLHSTLATSLTSSSSPGRSAEEIASEILGDADALTQQSRRNFGGIEYFDTSVDQRFRTLFVLGGPGSGKGTQSEYMLQNFPVAHFSVGELLRNVPADSPHKTTIEEYLVAGKIVPVEMSLALLKSAMEQARESMGQQILFLVDGFPRNYDNLSGWCRSMGTEASLESVLVYQCPLNVLEERVLERAKHSGRSDDNLASVHKRFQTFETETCPAIDVLRSVAKQSSIHRWDVVDIDGNRPLEQVWESTQDVLKQLVRDDVLTANVQLLESIESRNIEAYERLSDAAMFDDDEVAKVFNKQEHGIPNSTTIANAKVEVITGKQVSVCYERRLDDESVIEEKRFWSHKGANGWRHVHFVRKPVELMET